MLITDAGRGNEDYPTLLNTAECNAAERQVIVCFLGLSHVNVPPGICSMIYRRLLATLGLGMLAFFSGGTAAESSADGAFSAYYRNYLEEEFRLHPTMATTLGDHRFDHLLDDVSPASRARWSERTRATLAELPTRIAYAALSRATQVDYEIFRDDLKRSLWLDQHENAYENDPRVYGSFATDSVYRLFAQSTVDKATNVRNAIARMKQVPAILAVARVTLKNPPRVVVDTASKQNKGAIAFYEQEIFDLIGENAQQDALKAAAAEVVAALRVHQQFLDNELLPRATGEWRIGKERFARKLDLVLDAGVTAEQVRADATVEFDRVRRDMAFLARQLWSRYFPKRAAPPEDAAGTHQIITFVLQEICREHGKAEELSRDIRGTVDGLKNFITSRNILRLPDPDLLKVMEMPEFQRGNSIADLSSAPPLDPNAASIYNISPPPKDWDQERVESYLQEYNGRMLQILTIHEAYPGHYVQLSKANRASSLLRNVLGSGVYTEGWAVYCEQMMLDQGYGDGDLALRLLQKKFYLRTVANAILDHDMHCTDMTDEQAQRFLVEDAFQSKGEAALKVIRAKQGSCQLSTYFVGRRAMFNTRHAVQHKQGERFDIGRYHEAVIAQGAVPVKYLQELVFKHLSIE